MPRANRTSLATCLLTLLATIGCQTPDPHPGPRSTDVDRPRDITTSAAMWQPDLNTDEGVDTFIVTEVVDIRDTLRNAKHDARLAAMQRAVEKVTREVLESQGKRFDLLDAEAKNRVASRILNQPQKYLRQEPYEVDTMTRGNQYAIKLKVAIDRDKIARALQDLRLIRQGRQAKKILVVIYRNRNVDETLIQDLGLQIAGTFNQRGLNAILFEDLKADIEEQRTIGRKGTDWLLTTFQDDPEFGGDSDAVQGGLKILRNYAKAMIGFNVYRIARNGNQLEAQVEAHMKDLLQGRVLFRPLQKFGAVRIAGDEALARKKLIYQLARQLAEEIVDDAHRALDQLEEGKRISGKRLTLIFRKFADDDQAEITRLLKNTIGNDVKLVDVDEGYLEFEVVWDPEAGMDVPQLADKILLNLAKVGLKAKIPGGTVPDDATKIKFTRAR